MGPATWPLLGMWLLMCTHPCNGSRGRDHCCRPSPTLLLQLWTYLTEQGAHEDSRETVATFLSALKVQPLTGRFLSRCTSQHAAQLSAGAPPC